ncbi:Uncharacterised protein [Mycobacteroides abscessus subsp. abscessus]|nr:Uncharacterised protein [Mycobacteroides abscessus subsp. abscessus]
MPGLDLAGVADQADGSRQRLLQRIGVVGYIPGISGQHITDQVARLRTLGRDGQSRNKNIRALGGVEVDQCVDGVAGGGAVPM